MRFTDRNGNKLIIFKKDTKKTHAKLHTLKNSLKISERLFPTPTQRFI